MPASLLIPPYLPPLSSPPTCPNPSASPLFPRLLIGLPLRFADDLSEFDESRETVQALIEEYRASESPDYVNWGIDRTPGEPDRTGFVERKPGEADLYDHQHG
eukprot:scaffold2714_cov123-Isochrysis_galbana.AAC.16